MLFLEYQDCNVTVFTVDSKGLAFVCQIAKPSTIHILRVSSHSVTFTTEREVGLEISKVHLSSKSARVLTRFKAKADGCPRGIIRTIPISNNFVIILARNQIFYLGWCKEYGYLLFRS